MPVLSYPKYWILLASLTLLISCSGGEGGTGLTDSNKDISLGKITQFGSIYVNGVRFDTTNTNINLDGLAGANRDLRLGMFATVRGTINADGVSGTADTVSIKEALYGVVESKVGNDVLIVMGQTVQVPSTTLFENGIDITQIAIGNTIEVSGYVQASGVISATRIEVIASPLSQSKLFGFVQNIMPSSQTFVIGNLNVNYGGADFSGLTAASLANNQYIEVKGSYDSTSNTLSATQVESEVLDVSSSSEVEIEGIVSSTASATEFNLNGIPVAINNSTRIRGGVLEDISLGMLVEVEGYFANGVLLAEEIDFSDSIRIEATVDTIDLQTNILTLVGMAGISVQVDSFTVYSSDLPNGINDLIANTDSIKIRAYRKEGTISPTIVAKRLDKRSATTNISLQGNILNTAIEPSLDILNVTINTSNFSINGFIKDGIPTSSVEFFSSISIDSLVEAKGTLSSNVIAWESVELKD